MNEQEQPRRRRHRLYRTSADWFGIAAMGLLMICSLVLLVYQHAHSFTTQWPSYIQRLSCW